jgi:RNA polymerase sigma-70 factor (ECF subfamily)
MVGQVNDAEDIVQEAFARFHQASERSAIRSAKAFLSAVTTRLCIDHLRSARMQRETYIGPWLPEPVVEDLVSDPSRHAELADSLSMAFLQVLETLTPVERAVFLLRDVFGYEYDEIAETVSKTENNCRQLANRARRHLEARKARFEVDARRGQELADLFAQALVGGLDGLMELLAEDIVLYSDGGGKVRAARRPICGRQRVATYLLHLARHGRLGVLHPLRVNGQPGFASVGGDGHVDGVMVLQIAEGAVESIRAVRNPDKLRHLNTGQER